MNYLLSIFSDLLIEIKKNDVKEAAAALAFYTLLTLSPVLVLFVAIGSFVADAESLENFLVLYFENQFGVGEAIISGILDNVFDLMSNILFTVLGLAFMFIALVGLVNHVRTVFYRIFSVTVRGATGVARSIKEKTLSAFYTVLLIVTVVLLIGGNLALSFLFGILDQFSDGFFISFLGDGLRMIILTAVMVFLFYLIYYFMSVRSLPKMSAFFGAVFASTLFIVLNFILSFYISYSLKLSLYEALTSIILFLIWIYLSSFVIFLGGEIAKIHAQRHKSFKKQEV